MRAIRAWLLRLGDVVNRHRTDRDLAAELESHLQFHIDDNLRAGMSSEEARRRALISLGGLDQTKESYRDRRGLPWLDSLMQDIRFGLRMLRKNPGFTAVAILTLAMAIGANAVVFSALNGSILRPLNVPHSRSLFQVRGAPDDASLSYPDYIDLRDRNLSFDGLAAYNFSQAGLDTGRNPSRAWVCEVSGNYFDALGIQPYLGRVIHAADERGPNSAPYIVLTYSYWHSHFQDDRGVVGRTVELNKHPFTILGVTPRGFRGTVLIFSPDFFVPIVNQEQVDGWNGLNDRGNRWVGAVLGHLKAGVTASQTVADLDTIGSYLEKTYPKEDTHMGFMVAREGLPGVVFGRAIKAFLAGLMMLASLILLAACANLGGLFAARAADRSREVALRIALGAGRTRILRQLFTEAVLLSIMGGGAGLWGSVVLLHWLAIWRISPQFPVTMPVNPDADVYVVALLLTLASGLLFGAAPVRQILRTDAYQIIKSGTTGTVGQRLNAREVLLGTQVAICAVLVTSSMVAVRGLLRSLQSDFGFEPRNVLLVDIDLKMAGYRDDAVATMQKRMIDAMVAIPGVSSAALVSVPPLHPACCSASDVFTAETIDLRPSTAAANVENFSASPGYFHAAGTALLAGRDFGWQDDKNAPPVAVVNGEFARRVFGSVTSTVGQYYKMPDGKRIQVVGVVQDGKYSLNLTDPLSPAMFLPILQSPSTETYAVVRSEDNAPEVAGAIRTKLRDLDSGLPSFIQPWNKAMDAALFPSRMAALSLGALGMIGSMLSITGVFGMAAYSVSKRLKELGIRMALGAQGKEVLQAALGRAVKLLVCGSGAGLILGILASRVLAFIVYQATPRDPVVLASVVGAMVLLGLVATWIPAHRALSIDPATLLREE